MPVFRPLMKRAAAALLAASLMAGCQTGGAQAGLIDLIPLNQDAAMGAEQHPKVVAQFGGAVKDARLTRWVEDLGRRLAAASAQPGFEWHFTVLDSDVVNAFALPGGYVYVTRGLLTLAKDEAEVAGVLAHEIGHVTARHSVARATRSTLTDLLAAGVGMALGNDTVAQLLTLGSGAMLASYSREQELEADALGVETLARAGYDPFAQATFLETLRRYEQYTSLRTGNNSGGFDLFATHPPTAERVETAARQARRYPPGGQRPVTPYLQAIDGMIWGDSPENGFVRATVFAHPVLGLRFEVPRGFSLLNGADAVVGKGPDGLAVSFDGGPVQGGIGDPVDYLVRGWAGDTPLQAVEPLTIAGRPAATGITRGQTDAGAADIRLVAVRWDARTIYRFTFLAPAGRLGAADGLFRQTAASLRPLTQAEAASLQPARVRAVTVRAGDTVEGLVAQMPRQPYAEELFRIINDVPPGTALEPGRGVKIITGG